jgi:predicted secreted Zn-dependent protease
VAVAEQEAAEAERRAAEAAERAARTQTPVPAPDAAGPGTYTAQPGDSLFSVAAALGLSPNELVYWNKEAYPTLQSTPALTPGWVLSTTGPPLPTASPRPTPTPRPIAPATPPPEVAGPGSLPAFGPGSFPASASVTVSYYAVSGSTPQQIHASIEDNGPWSDWLGRNAQAHVQVSPSFNFAFRSDGFGCGVVPTGGDFVTITYHVLLPSWTPPAGVSQRTVDWWIETIYGTVAHEGHHITLYESYLPQMNDAVRTGTCASVQDDLERLWFEVNRANCEFDLAEYGYAVGLTLESCLAQ